MTQLVKHILFLVVLFPLLGHSQISTSKKLGEENDIQQPAVQAQIDSARSIFETNSVQAIQLVENAITTAIKMKYDPELAEAYYTLATFNQASENHKSVISYAQKSQKIYWKLQNWDKVYEVVMFQGNACLQLADYTKALEHYKMAEELAVKSTSVRALLKARLKQAICQKNLGNLVLAEELFLATKTEAENNNLYDVLAEVELQLAEVYQSQGRVGDAVFSYNSATGNAYKNNDLELLNRTNQKMVDNFSGLSGYETNTQASLDKAEAFFKNKKDTASIVENALQKADYYIRSGDIDAATEELDETYALYGQLDDPEEKKNVQEKIYEAYQKTGKTEDPLLEKYKSLADSISRTSREESQLKGLNQLALINIEKQIDVLEKEQRLNQKTIDLLEKEKALNEDTLSQQRMLIYIFGCILLVFGAISVYVYRNNQAKKRAHQLLYLRSLRAQMNPHFIFNSLNSVNNYISKSDERAANKYLSKFSRLMRQVLDYSQVEFISLTHEIDLLKLYIELEHERFKDKFEYRFHTDTSINTEDYSIPPMLIQPFIENAIWHGLRYKKEPGLLTINFTDKTDYIEIDITDNGIGRKRSKALKTTNQKKHNSSGMRNAETRMAMIKDVFKAKVEHQIIDLPNDTGTQVILKLYRFV